MKSKLLVLFLCNNIFAFSQQTDREKIISLFQNSQKIYETASLMQINMQYNLFSSYTTNQVYEKTDGLFIKNKKQNYSKIGDTELVSLENYFIKIDHTNLLMNCAKKENSNSNTVIDLKSYIAHYTGFKLTTEGKYWVCTLTTPEFSQVPYTKVVVYISKSDSRIYKQVLYMIITKKFKIKNKNVEDFPRLEVTFLSHKTKDISLGNIFSLGKYVIVEKNKIIPSKEYNAFKIVD